MPPDENLATWAARAANELVPILASVEQNQLDMCCKLIVSANRIALHGLGREGLMMRAFAMRLFHLGLAATPVGDMNTPHIGTDDLLIVSAGPGDFETVGALMRIAKTAGATVVLMTAEVGAGLQLYADVTVLIPARTMAKAAAAVVPSLPLGSAYEGAMFLLCEHLVGRIAGYSGASESAMSKRHTNLE